MCNLFRSFAPLPELFWATLRINPFCGETFLFLRTTFAKFAQIAPSTAVSACTHWCRLPVSGLIELLPQPSANEHNTTSGQQDRFRFCRLQMAYNPALSGCNEKAPDCCFKPTNRHQCGVAQARKCHRLYQPHTHTRAAIAAPGGLFVYDHFTASRPAAHPVVVRFWHLWAILAPAVCFVIFSPSCCVCVCARLCPSYLLHWDFIDQMLLLLFDDDHHHHRSLSSAEIPFAFCLFFCCFLWVCAIG